MNGERIRRILVGLDGSVGSTAALRWAIGLAKALDAQVLAVHVLETPVQRPAPLGAAVAGAYCEQTSGEPWRLAVKSLFESSWCVPLQESGVRFRTVFEEGRAGAVLVQIAERERADLIVTGRRGLGSLAELVAGSVSQHLVHRAGRPVVIVPESPAGRQGQAPSLRLALRSPAGRSWEKDR